MRDRTNGTLLPDDIPQRLSTVSSAAVDWQVHSSLVWRKPRRVDDMHAVFSVVPFVRIRLCSLDRELVDASDAKRCAHRGHRGDNFPVANHSKIGVEANRIG